MRKKKKSDDELFPCLRGQGMIAVDCETRDPDLKTKGSGAHKGGDHYIAGVAVGTEVGFREYYPVGHEPGGNLPRDKVMAWLSEQLCIEVPKVGANLLYDIGFLDFAGVDMVGPFYDVQVAEPLLNENRFSYSLEALSKDYLGIGKIDDELDEYLKEHFDKKNPKAHIWRAPVEIVRPYAIGDVNHPLEIFAKQKVELERQGLWNLFIMESKLIPMLWEMRKRGVKVDLPHVRGMLDRLTEEQAKLQRKIGDDVAVWEAASIAKVFDELGHAYPLTPKTKKPSFTKGFLENSPLPIAKDIVEIRRLDKMRGTFLQGSILDNQHAGRIHCQFNQLKGEAGGAVSGRFSSSIPNLQFIPTRTAEGKMIRSAFIPDDGQLWYKIDFSQIEYRLIVHDAADMRLKGAEEVAQIYNADPNADFHQVVADMVFGSEGTPEQLKDFRVKAKTINFGLAYGEGVDKLCASLGLSREEGEALLKEYHRRAPFIRPLSQMATGVAQRIGIVETLMGRRRRFDAWEISKWNSALKKRETVILREQVRGSKRAFTHAALNARIQGSAADIMKESMVQVWESGIIDAIGVPQLTVHDELDGSFPDNKIGWEALREMKHILESCVKLRVPLVAELEVGKNWGKTEKLTSEQIADRCRRKRPARTSARPAEAARSVRPSRRKAV